MDNKYKVEMKITTPEGEEIIICNDTSCPDCQKALEFFVKVENVREKRNIETITYRVPIIMIVDPDYNNTVHFEKMNKTISDIKKENTLSDYEKAFNYAKENLMHYVIGYQVSVSFVNKLKSKFNIGLKEAVDIYKDLRII